jgi:hypothetical protein
MRVLRQAFVLMSVVIAALVLVVFIQQAFFFKPERDFTKELADVVPSTLPGWEVTEIELADSPEAQSRVEGILNFTDAVQRVYTRGNQQFIVYVAYWAPKTMPIRLVQAHTPEICWVRVGWDLLPEASESNVQLTVGDTQLKPAEYRELTSEGQPITHVYYWHVVGDDVYTTQTSAGTWNRWDPLKSLFEHGLNQKMEQFFVRISSETSLDELMQDPQVQKLVQELADFSIAAPNGH